MPAAMAELPGASWFGSAVLQITDAPLLVNLRVGVCCTSAGLPEASTTASPVCGLTSMPPRLCAAAAGISDVVQVMGLIAIPPAWSRD